MHALREVIAHQQHLRDKLRCHAVAIEPPEDLERGHRAQQYGPFGRLGAQPLASPPRVSPAGFEQPRRIVRSFDEGSDSSEVQSFVAQQGSGCDSARQMRAVFDPFQEFTPSPIRASPRWIHPTRGKWYSTSPTRPT